jgi:dTDP-4-amino-4,6-dideoxygalactose transaminase
MVPVHYAGVGCAMDAICGLAAKYGITLVEDNAHGLFAKYKGRYLGTFAPLATQSFHETKNITCGEGGALLVNDVRFKERSEILREKGTNRSRFYRGQVDKYTWVDIGSSYLPSDILSAYLFAQLESWEAIQRKRSRIWQRYAEGLTDWAASHGVQTPQIPAECEQAYHMYYILLPSLGARTALITHLKARGILSVFHYLPLHLSDMGKKYGGVPGQCPITESVSDRLLRLPFYNDLTESEQDEVISAVLDFHVDATQKARA